MFSTIIAVTLAVALGALVIKTTKSESKEFFLDYKELVVTCVSTEGRDSIGSIIIEGFKEFYTGLGEAILGLGKCLFWLSLPLLLVLVLVLLPFKLLYLAYKS